MGLRAFSRHKVEWEWDVRDNYRRLLILSNRMHIFGDTILAPDIETKETQLETLYTFYTNLGQRTLICSWNYDEKNKKYMRVYYLDDNNKVLFKIYTSLDRYSFYGKYQNEKYIMDEREAWLAIYELEQLSYIELDKNDK